MNIETVIDPTRVAQIGTASVIGVDIGSRTAKAAFLHQGQLHVAQVATGVFMQETADELLEGLLDQANASRDEVDFIVGTGYGRVLLAKGVLALALVGLGWHNRTRWTPAWLPAGQ